jgi:hypothetical protein
MSRLLSVILLVAILSIPGLAASTAMALPYNLVLSSRPTPSVSTGTVIGQFGGVPVAGTYSGNSSCNQRSAILPATRGFRFKLIMSIRSSSGKGCP